MQVVIISVALVSVQQFAGQFQRSGGFFHLSAVAFKEAVNNTVVGLHIQGRTGLIGDGNHMGALGDSQLGSSNGLRSATTEGTGHHHRGIIHTYRSGIDEVVGSIQAGPEYLGVLLQEVLGREQIRHGRTATYKEDAAQLGLLCVDISHDFLNVHWEILLI